MVAFISILPISCRADSKLVRAHLYELLSLLVYWIALFDFAKNVLAYAHIIFKVSDVLFYSFFVSFFSWVRNTFTRSFFKDCKRIQNIRGALFDAFFLNSSWRSLAIANLSLGRTFRMISLSRCTVQSWTSTPMKCSRATSSILFSPSEIMSPTSWRPRFFKSSKNSPQMPLPSVGLFRSQ